MPHAHTNTQVGLEMHTHRLVCGITVLSLCKSINREEADLSTGAAVFVVTVWVIATLVAACDPVRAHVFAYAFRDHASNGVGRGTC